MAPVRLDEELSALAAGAIEYRNELRLGDRGTGGRRDWDSRTGGGGGGTNIVPNRNMSCR